MIFNIKITINEVFPILVNASLFNLMQCFASDSHDTVEVMFISVQESSQVWKQ